MTASRWKSSWAAQWTARGGSRSHGSWSEFLNSRTNKAQQLVFDAGQVTGHVVVAGFVIFETDFRNQFLSECPDCQVKASDFRRLCISSGYVWQG
jgi:hypothetical protein